MCGREISVGLGCCLTGIEGVVGISRNVWPRDICWSWLLSHWDRRHCGHKSKCVAERYLLVLVVVSLG